ncbi:zeatin O-glucosyltransferase-like [Humulus lupulus]|uniref:zeatin O-glucosyltransferase-like n=1 Tax=Humulus lupulus TaxID=3486 RepID=UPI002B417113|nr:zeatin O-glucosyltransferase-like [Humulus lupulus]
MSSDQVEIVMVPLPAQGHLNQLLHLSRLISAYGVSVHFASTTTHNRQARIRVQGWNPNTTQNIHFHDFDIPSFPTPPPDPISPNKFPSHLVPSFHAAATHLRHPVAALLRHLSSKAKRVVVIRDSLMASVVQDVASIPNVESYTLRSISAFAMFLMLYNDVVKEKVSQEVLALTNEIVPEDVPSIEGCLSTEFLDFTSSQNEFRSFTSGYLYNTSKVIESAYMDLLAKIVPNKNHWAIGPFHPLSFLEKKTSNDSSHHFCLKWLDKQESNSVIYVSFGTTTTFSDEQIEQLALGLEQSDIKFIWVLREADKGSVFDGEKQMKRYHYQLPKGYEERVEHMGIVMREWAPQLEILGHPSTGAFLSHCGWNSCVESMTMGVPIGAWPMHTDQPRNAVLVTKVLGVGAFVREWTHRDDVAKANRVADEIRKLMASGKIRKRAKDLGGSLRRSMAEGGDSRMELDSFVSYISR